MSLVDELKGYIKKGDFTLSSGRKSSYYVDIKKAYTDPDILREIALGMANLISDEKPDGIAGMAVGGIPIATALSLETGIPFLVVRKELKGHGTYSRIEGEITPGSKVVVVEDVVTTGGSALSAVEVIRESNGICDTVLVVVDREEGAKENLLKNGVELRPLVSAKELVG
ncbi:MAG: orotate phosphoribosyltransferase [Candidatus Hydrothermarchaeaceae archaeon]